MFYFLLTPAFKAEKWLLSECRRDLSTYCPVKTCHALVIKCKFIEIYMMSHIFLLPG